MKRSLIITIGILIILLVLGLWIYLLVFGTPKETNEVFANLGIITKNEDEVAIVETNTLSKNETQLALDGSPLQQLTTKAVAGFAATSSSDQLIRYVERGTGHIYEINLDKGTEKQITLLTLPQTVEATFSPSANSVAFTTFKGSDRITSVGTIPEEGSELIVTKLPPNAEQIAFKDDLIIYYTRRDNNETTGYAYNISNHSESELFTTTLTDITVFWGYGFDTIYIQTKPTQHLEGFLYKISKNILTPITEALYGLTTFIESNNMIISQVVDDEYISTWTRTSGELKQGILMLKEKCVFTEETAKRVWCAAPLPIPNASYVENWYKGTITSEDYLWSTDLVAQNSTLIENLTESAGKIIDVFDMKISDNRTSLLFTNKIDQTLWSYRIKQ